ncbi:hypothetical protein EJ110_NYTH39940, partial [Nymphaea thermarum]
SEGFLCRPVREGEAVLFAGRVVIVSFCNQDFPAWFPIRRRGFTPIGRRILSGKEVNHFLPSINRRNLMVFATVGMNSEKFPSLTRARIVKAFILCIPLSALLLALSFTADYRSRSSLAAEKASSDLHVRRSYKSYEEYVNRQMRKTLDPKLRQIWTTQDWMRKVEVFSQFFSRLRDEGLLRNESKCLCVGARVGQEVQALRDIGVNDSVGIDLVPYPPLVQKGDFHSQPFANDTFDFEFSNVFDHALYPDRFVGEIERTLKPGGICVLHLIIRTRGDKYSANDLFSVRPLIHLFKRSDVVHVRQVDGFGLDTEIVLRKKSGRSSS